MYNVISGKSTLMKAIAGGNLAGFPTELITVYVECEIIGEKADMTVLNYIMSDPKVRTHLRAILSLSVFVSSLCCLSTST